MSEILFHCGECGIALKVYGDDQAGTQITCPACNAPVTVPTVGHTAPPSGSVEESAPAAGGGTALGATYLVCIVAVTTALVVFLLLPALRAPAPVAQVVAEKPGPVAKRDPDTTVKTPRTKRPSIPRRPIAELAGSEPLRELVDPAAPVESSPPTVARDDTADSTTPPPATRFPAPSAAGFELNPAPPPKAPALPPVAGGAEAEKPAAAAPVMNDGSPFSHIANAEARKNLSFALINTRNAKATYTAEVFLKAAERAAHGDPAVLSEVRKLRAKIIAVRNREP